MSTKTSFKRIALVAASALAIAGFSAVPANAVTGGHANTITASSATLGGSATAATATGAVGTAVTFTLTSTTTTPDAADTVILTPVLTGTAVVNAASSVTVASTKTSVTATDNTTVAYGTPNATTGAVTGTLTAVAGASTVVYGFTPDVAGTYIYTISTTGTSDVTSGAVTFTYTATLAGPKFLTTGNNPAPVAASVTSGSALVAVAGGFAKFTIAQGSTNTLYNISATGMSITGASTQLNRTVDTTQLWTPLNGVNVGGGVQWAPASVAGYITITVASAVAGTGTLTVAPIGATGLPGTPITGTVTWGSPLAASTQYSLLKLLDGNVATDVTTATADTTSTTVASTAGTQRFTIQAETNDQNGSPITMAALNASITGPGTLGIADSRTAAASSGRSLTVALTGAFGSVSVFGDGSSGTAVITVSVTNSAGVTTVLGSKTVIFTGAPAKATATQNLYIAKAGTQLGATPTTTLAAATTVATTPAITATVVDSLGNPVAAGSTVKLTSSNAAIITVGTCAELTVDGSALAGATPTPGVFECSVSGAASAVSGTSATVTFSVLNAATGAYDILAAPLTFKIGGAIATTAVTLDKASYSTGEAMVLTATAKDSAGNAAYDGQDPYSTDATANKTVSGLDTVGSETVDGSSVLKATLFAPATTGEFIISGKGTNTAGTGTAFAITADVEGDATASLALDAANAATDAANNAYDEAQNATQAASDALAAVTALAAQVKSLIASVKKLTAAVAKLKK